MCQVENIKKQITNTKQITMTEISNPKLDEIVISHIIAWIPACAGMTDIVSDWY
jgi:hypothetical protein